MAWKPIGNCQSCGAELFTDGLSVTDTWSGARCTSAGPTHRPPAEFRRDVEKRRLQQKADQLHELLETWKTKRELLLSTWDGVGEPPETFDDISATITRATVHLDELLAETRKED
jgi:hypothetical protein